MCNARWLESFDGYDRGPDRPPGEIAMQRELATEIGRRPSRIDWANDQELFYWAMKWRVRSEDIKDAALSVGSNVRKIEAFLRNKGWLR